MLAQVDMDRGPRTMVQVYILTIGGIKHALIGPVIHLPALGMVAGDIQELEFGDVLPADMAAKMINGEAWDASGIHRS